MSGLARYRSAPSSYFTGILGGGGGGGAEDYVKLFNPGASSSETHRIFSRCMNATDLTAAAQHPPPPLPPRQKPSQRRRSGEHPPPMAPSRATNSGLIRQSSSPAGLFDSILMEIDAGRFEEKCGNDSRNIPDSPWDDIDPAFLSDDFLNRLAEEDNKIFAKPGASDDQGSEGENQRPARLSRHLSLPKSFANMSVVDKLLQDSVPCKLRAKRGRATHPRSIAERVRRNKISERMRKLQELVPNMDRQTNTADMLDFATDYIKDLQQEVKILSDNRAKCICSLKKEP